MSLNEGSQKSIISLTRPKNSGGKCACSDTLTFSLALSEGSPSEASSANAALPRLDENKMMAASRRTWSACVRIRPLYLP